MFQFPYYERLQSEREIGRHTEMAHIKQVTIHSIADSICSPDAEFFCAL